MFGEICVALDDLCSFPFRASVWGTAGQWASALMAGLSLIFAWYVIFRDHRREERKHVVTVAGWIEEDGIRRDGYVVNSGDLPVIRPKLVMVPRRYPAVVWKRIKLPADERNGINLKRSPLLSHTQTFSYRKIKHDDPTGNINKLSPGEEGFVDWFIAEMPTGMYKCYLTFSDAAGEEWARRIPGGDVVSGRKLRRMHKRVSKLKKKWDRSKELQRQMEANRRPNGEDEGKDEIEG